MIGLWVALVGAMLLALNLASDVPEQQRQSIHLAADVSATNFYSYRSAVTAYLNVNPGATGTIADASLTFPLGYIRDPRWTNLIQGGVLYVYSTGTAKMGEAQAMYEKGGKSLLIGLKGPSGNLISATGTDTGIALPASIPAGATTIVGI